MTDFWMLFASQSSIYWQAYHNSIFLLITCLIGQSAISILGGWGLARYSFIGRKTLLCACVILALFPPQVMLFPQYLLLEALGLLGSLWGIVLLSICAPLGSVLLWHGFSVLSDEMIEAAQLEGASTLHVLWKIALPNCKQQLAVFCFIASAEIWSLLEQPMVYLKDSSLYPLSVYLSTAAYQSKAQLAIDALLALVPMFIIFALLFQQMARLVTPTPPASAPAPS